MPSLKIIELRQTLAEKFPHSRVPLNRPAGSTWVTGLPQIDGLPRGALTELIAGQKSTGSATVIRALMKRAAHEQRIIAYVDGNDSLDVTQIEGGTLARLLWVRTRSAEAALKALDLILRDQNLGFIIVDLAFNLISQLRRISPTAWYRFQRLVENTEVLCAVVTPYRMVIPAELHIELQSRFSLLALEAEQEKVLMAIKTGSAETECLEKAAQQFA